MRLIDADEVKALVPKKLRRLIDGSEIEETTYQYEVIKAINTAKTINAIPIEWIRKYYEDITMPYTDTRIQFEELIRKWEKENEGNQT